jgi:NAD(P) transhydrogenase
MYDRRVLTADKFLVAVGTRPAHPPDMEFDGTLIFDSDQILWGGIKTVPKRLIIVGAGVIGMEYASMMSIIPGTQVTVIDGRRDILEMADKEVTDALCHAMRQRGARFLTEETIEKVEKHVARSEVEVVLKSGKRIMGDALLYTQGRLYIYIYIYLPCIYIYISTTYDFHFPSATRSNYDVACVLRVSWWRNPDSCIVWRPLSG